MSVTSQAQAILGLEEIDGFGCEHLECVVATLSPVGALKQEDEIISPDVPDEIEPGIAGGG